MKKIRQIFTLGILTLIIVVFAIGLIFTAEILWRSFGPTASRSTLIDTALFPYKNYVVTTHPDNLELGKSNHILEGFFGKEIDTKDGLTAVFNKDGFRTHDLQNVPPKEPGEIRIIITGGSASISWNISEAATLDSHLYRLFAKHYPNQKVRIFNLGNGAWKSFQELIALQLHGLPLEPDLIIAFDGFNDIQHSYSMPIQTPYCIHTETASKNYAQWVQGKVGELFKNFKLLQSLKNPSIGMIGRAKSTVKSALAQLDPEFAKEAAPGKLATHMNYPLEIAEIKARADFDPYNREVVNFYLDNERMMAKAAEMMNAKMMVVLQPILYTKTPLSENERRILDSYTSSVNFAIQGYERMKEGLQQLAAEEKHVSFYDMSNVFEGDERSYFGDYCHFSKEGYEIVSHKLFSHIERILFLKNEARQINANR